MHASIRFNVMKEFSVNICHTIDMHILLLLNWSKLRGVRLWALKSMYSHFGESLHMLDVMCWWCFDVGNNSRINIPLSIDQVLDSHLVQMLINIDALLDQQWQTAQHPQHRSE